MILVAAAAIVGAIVLANRPVAPPPPAPPQETVVLLPQADGRPAAVTVTRAGNTTTLDKPYAAAQDGQAVTFAAAQVQQVFGAALAAQPPRPLSFTLYFVEGRNELTAQSQQALTAAMAEITKRPAPDIVVVGHTDTQGSAALNDMLSRTRAQAIRDEFLKRGIAPDAVEASGRGKRELLVPTPDNIAEPRNRRVEITVR
jgi:outer membrane protein OmpA-like peptidoglycan-associated protein